MYKTAIYLVFALKRSLSLRTTIIVPFHGAFMGEKAMCFGFINAARILLLLDWHERMMPPPTAQEEG